MYFISGDFRLIRSLDYEKQKEFHLVLTANFTSNNVVTTVPIRVYVWDVNDVCPVFTQQLYAVQHTEPLRKDLVIVKLKVNDPDVVGNLTYTITAGDSRFSINDMGEVFIKDELQTNTSMLSTNYPLQVSVSDGKCSNGTTVHVFVYKIVIGSFLFPQPFYKVDISENQPVPYTVEKLINVGGHPANYSLLVSTDFFEIDRATGTFTQLTLHPF